MTTRDSAAEFFAAVTSAEARAAVGILKGYAGGFAEDHPKPTDAQREVYMHLPIETTVHAAVSVYQTKWGCPVGGEPVAYVMGDVNYAALRRRFAQSTVSIAGSKGTQPTRAVVANLGKGELNAVATLWQLRAAEHMAAKGVYPSVCLVDGMDLNVYAVAELNPVFISDTSAWEDAMADVITFVSRGTSRAEFFDTGFTYLQGA